LLKKVSDGSVKQFKTNLSLHNSEKKMGIFVSRNGFSKPCYNFVKKYDDIFLINLEEENIINRIKSYYNLISKEYQIQEDECYIQYSSSSSFKINISFNKGLCLNPSAKFADGYFQFSLWGKYIFTKKIILFYQQITNTTFQIIRIIYSPFEIYLFLLCF